MTLKSGKSRFWIAACIVSVLLAAGRPEAQRKGERGMSAATHRELAAARSATAKYHDRAQAEADGYVNANFYVSHEGFHWLNESLVDDVFDPARPEVLLYAEVPGEKRLQLVAVEYIVPVSAGRPAGSSSRLKHGSGAASTASSRRPADCSFSTPSLVSIDPLTALRTRQPWRLDANLPISR
jgi:hypothetical protein